MSALIIEKLFRFIIVGFSGLFVDFSITYVLKEKIKVQQFIANAIGFMTAATSNYFLNRIWTFHSNNPEIIIEYSKFIFIAAIGLAINTFILWFLVSRFKWNFYFSKLFAIAVVTLWNFSINLLYTFV